MNRTVARRLERLEERAAVASKKWTHSVRILLVDPQDECTGVIVMETGKPNREETPIPEEVEHVRAELEQRRAAARRPTDIRSYRGALLNTENTIPGSQ
jgi:hypothetical protein